MKTLKQQIFYNKILETYGKAYIIKRELLIAVIIVFCMITPLTNWILLFIHKLIKENIIWRFN